MQSAVTSLNDILEFNPDNNTVQFKYRPLEHFKSVAERNRWNYRYGGMTLNCLPGPDCANAIIFQ